MHNLVWVVVVSDCHGVGESKAEGGRAALTTADQVPKAMGRGGLGRASRICVGVHVTLEFIAVFFPTPVNHPC